MFGHSRDTHGTDWLLLLARLWVQCCNGVGSRRYIQRLKFSLIAFVQIHFVLVCLGPSPTKGCSCIVLIAIDVYLCHVSRIGQSRKTCSTDWGSCQVTGVIHGVFGDWLEELIKRSVKACSVITLRAILLYVFVWSDHITWPVMCPICGSIVPVSAPFVARIASDSG